LRGPWDEKVDIWIFGCLVFELVTGAALFQHKPHEEHGITEPEAAHLWQMMLFTKRLFTPEQLENSRRALDYFGHDCKTFASSVHRSPMANDLLQVDSRPTRHCSTSLFPSRFGIIKC